VRIRKRSIRARVKGDLSIAFTEEALSAHGGLELIRRFLDRSGFIEQLRKLYTVRQFESDYGSLRMTLLLIAMLIVGGRRLRHLGYLEQDPIVRRFAGLHQLPTDRTVSHWLKDLGPGIHERLNDLLREVAYGSARHARIRRATIDLDGTVLRTGLLVDGAERGFNPHHPKDKSYYPLTAHLAQTGQLLGIWNRPGNVTDSHEALEKLEFLVDDVREQLGPIPTEVRLDGAFCQPQILRFLADSGVEWAMRIPLWEWLPIRGEIAKRKRWKRVAPGIDGFFLSFPIEKWGVRLRVAIYRKHVSHETRKNFQLDLFSPDDGHWEYSAIASNKRVTLRTLWAFLAGRGGHEKTLGELKQHLAFDVIPTNEWGANSAWQLISALTLNLIRQFQLQTDAPMRSNGRKRTYRFVLQSLRTMRFELIHLPAKLARPGGRRELRIAAPPAARQRIIGVLDALETVA
jgi:hypothetical protein